MIFQVIISVFLILLWIGYSILEGIKEGYLYAYRDPDDDGYDMDLHGIFFEQRVIVSSMIVLPMFFYISWYLPLIFLTANAMIFPLLHDGFYYETRKDLSDGKIYPKGFLMDGNQSTAKISIKSSFGRIFLAMGGCIAYGFYFHFLTI